MSLITRFTHEVSQRLLNPQRYLVRRPCAAAGQRPGVYLTFDDGPHPDRTNRILDQFADFGGHGTFFVIGRNARRHPRAVRRILDEGHSIGCHTWSHWSARRCSAAAYLRDVRQSRDIIQQITGRPIDLFRPPYGELTPLTLWLLLTDGFRIVHWSRDTRDFELPSVCALSQTFDQQPLADGDIVLLHDDCAVTSYALDQCLPTWAGKTEFRAIPMDADFHPLQADAPSTLSNHRATATPVPAATALRTEEREG